MKRTYVKPVMESEAFVANEYVAACWKVTCDTATGHGDCKGSSTIISDADRKDCIKKMNFGSPFPDGNLAIQPGNWYNGEIGGRTTWHHVSIEEATNSNAS